ncbi:hypothetical protein D3C71_1223880 [compost metagenome]
MPFQHFLNDDIWQRQEPGKRNPQLHPKETSRMKQILSLPLQIQRPAALSSPHTGETACDQI